MENQFSLKGSYQYYSQIILFLSHIGYSVLAQYNSHAWKNPHSHIKV